MPSDIRFKKAIFGGFDREDVMAYLADIKNRENELNEQLEQAKTKNQELENELQPLRDSLNGAQENLDTMKNLYEEKISAMQISHTGEIERIKKEYEEKILTVQSEMTPARSAEERVGTAMLDVRRYADLLLQETCQKINKMADDADSATAKTLSRVMDISSGIQTFSDKLNGILKDLVAENEQICKELVSFQGSLKLPFENAAANLPNDIFED